MTMLMRLVLAALPLAAAIDYPGGWRPDDQCVDICEHATKGPVCPTHDPECLAKQNRPGDFDFLVLEQLFVPQFCRDLLAGVDPTISHRNVNKYPVGIECEPSRARSRLSVHGLWPNYKAGFSACCDVSDDVRNQPFDPLGFAAESTGLLAAMDEVWIDPTQPSSFRTLCELYNHEFQKHGLCYAATGGHNFEESARGYFRAVLRAASVNRDATETINRWAASSSPKTTLAEVSALYPTHVQVLCSAVGTSTGDNVGNRLAAIHVCFDKPANSSATLTPIDCETAVASAVFIPCSPGVPIMLDRYVAPTASKSASLEL